MEIVNQNIPFSWCNIFLLDIILWYCNTVSQMGIIL